MKILAIDSSCDESCAAILDTEKWQLLSNVVHSHIAGMQAYGGIVPEIASREHLNGVPQATQEALSRARLSIREIDYFAVTNRPGLIGALLVGLNFAKSTAFALNKPFGVYDHLEGHLYSPLLSTLEAKTAPAFPWIALVVSGGHTEIYHVTSPEKAEWLGGTLDDAAGEAYDKIGKLLGLNYPAGPLIDKISQPLWKAHPYELITGEYGFPISLPNDWDFSYSGLKTSVLLTLKKNFPTDEKQRTRLIAYAQEAILAPLVKRARQALNSFPNTHLVVSGGVACNSRLRSLIPEAHFPEPRFCTDNAAMIALLAGLKAKSNSLVNSPWSETAHARNLCGS